MTEVTWIDDEGNARIWHDDNYQMVTFTSASDVELRMASWDMALACNMIVFGDGMDRMSLIEYGLTECPHGTTGNDRAHHSLTCMNRFSKLARAAIAIGILKEHNTPANWIKWAESKNYNYNTDHLNPAIQIEALQIAIQECPDDCPSVRAGYREQLEQWQAVGDAGAGSPTDTEPAGVKVTQDNETRNEIELTRWLRETWIKEGKLGGTAFFNMLKKYEKQKGSPITQHYGAGKDAGFDWLTSYGTSGSMKKKTVATKVSIFKNTP
ncbi:MAG: hypothetical protein NTY50_00385 [Methylobacter sp.]|nr:hypothetical protein [Methylobacter sp.]